MELSRVVAIVTGAASGLGLASAARLARGGAHVVALDLPRSRGGEVIAELNAALGEERVVFSGGCITQENDVAAAIEAAEKWGGVNVAVNCAGIAPAIRTVSKQRGAHPLDMFSNTLNVNVTGTFNVVRLAAERMSRSDPDRDNQRGVIINTASVAAFDGQIGQAAYSASKGAITAMTLPLARDLSKLGIRVVTIAPGLFNTALLAGLPERVREELGRTVPNPSRLGDPDEFGQMVQSVVENAMMNGETIRLDGAIRMMP